MGGKRRGHRAYPAGCALALVAGCAATGVAPTGDWTEPAWMAEHTQRREEFVPRLQACIDAHGWDLTVTESAGFEEMFTSDDEAARAQVDKATCLREQGIDIERFGGPQSAAELRKMYAYDVDTYQCLLAHGVELENEPPSADTYVDEALAAYAGDPVDQGWWGFLDPVIMAMPRGQIADLERACPARWVFAAL